jgi:thiamine monophosphate kinase
MKKYLFFPFSMAVLEHIASEEYEQEIIALANSFPALRHPFDDCGHVDESFCGLEKFLVRFDNPEDLSEITKGNFKDALVSVQLNKSIAPQNYSDFFSRLNDFVFERKLNMSKGNTTFTSGKPYALIALTHGRYKPSRIHFDKSFVILGTIDTYVEGRHFLNEASDGCIAPPGFYAACAACSDIGANGGEVDYMDITLVNPGMDRSGFLEQANEAADFLLVPKVVTDYLDADELGELGEFAAAFTVIGKVKRDMEMTLDGLEEGMGIYVAGRAGVSGAAGYAMPKEHLMHNLDPRFRKEVFNSIKHKALCNDVSDGVHKSLKNLLRNNPGLDLNINNSELLLTGENPFSIKVNLEDIKYGGDDYSLVIAAHSDFGKIEGVRRIGTAVKGEGRINYS